MIAQEFFNVAPAKTIAEIAEIGECKLHGNTFADKLITGVASLEVAGANDVTFLSNPKYTSQLEKSLAGACILSAKNIDKATKDTILLLSENPYLSYAKIAAAFYPDDMIVAGISAAAFVAQSSVIDKTCQILPNVVIESACEIGSGTYIGAGAYVGRGVKIGKNCRIAHGVTLSHCNIGDNVLIHPGVRIGQDGFGFASGNGVHVKVPQLGRVIIENNVEIGANSCIDRGAGPDTIIGSGTKIDNLVQIGHNVQIGKNCIIVAQVGIAGSTKLGDYVVLGGQVGVAGHLNIGSMVNVAAQSGVAQDVAAKHIIGGSPAVPIKQWHRQTVALKKLVMKVEHKHE